MTENSGHNNLIPPKHGEVRNPKGKPKGTRNRSTVLKELYELVISGKDLSEAEAKMPVEVAMMQALVKKALQGDVAAIKEAQDSVYGKIVDKSETNLNMTTMGSVIRNGKELEFNIGKPPLGKREQLEDDNE